MRATKRRSGLRRSETSPWQDYRPQALAWCRCRNFSGSRRLLPVPSEATTTILVRHDRPTSDGASADLAESSEIVYLPRPPHVARAQLLVTWKEIPKIFALIHSCQRGVTLYGVREV